TSRPLPSVSYTVPAVALALIASFVTIGARIGQKAATSQLDGRSWRHMSFGWLIATIMAFGVSASVTFDVGYLPLIVRWGVLLAVGAAIGLAVVSITSRGLGADPLSRRHMLGLVPIAALIAVPWGELNIRNLTVGWWDLLSYAAGVNGILALV